VHFQPKVLIRVHPWLISVANRPAPSASPVSSHSPWPPTRMATRPPRPLSAANIKGFSE
jgi:hypothetical protein